MLCWARALQPRIALFSKSERAAPAVWWFWCFCGPTAPSGQGSFQVPRNSAILEVGSTNISRALKERYLWQWLRYGSGSSSASKRRRTWSYRKISTNKKKIGNYPLSQLFYRHHARIVFGGTWTKLTRCALWQQRFMVLWTHSPNLLLVECYRWAAQR